MTIDYSLLDCSDCICDECPYSRICPRYCSNCSCADFCDRLGSTEGDSPLS